MCDYAWKPPLTQDFPGAIDPSSVPLAARCHLLTRAFSSESAAPSVWGGDCNEIEWELRLSETSWIILGLSGSFCYSKLFPGWFCILLKTFLACFYGSQTYSLDDLIVKHMRIFTFTVWFKCRMKPVKVEIRQLTLPTTIVSQWWDISPDPGLELLMFPDVCLVKMITRSMHLDDRCDDSVVSPRFVVEIGEHVKFCSGIIWKASSWPCDHSGEVINHCNFIDG